MRQLIASHLISGIFDIRADYTDTLRPQQGAARVPHLSKSHNQRRGSFKIVAIMGSD